MKFIKKYTGKFLNVIEVSKNGVKWEMVSRNKKPFSDKPAAVVIVPINIQNENPTLIVTKEFRYPLNDYEYGLPAGLIDDNETIEETTKRELFEETGLDVVDILSVSKPIYSSSGITDESIVMVYCTYTGEISKDNLEKEEDITTYEYNIDDVKNLLLDPDKKIGAKAWFVMNSFVTAYKK